jgi:ABC-type multidrug transport system ATPase subunit
VTALAGVDLEVPARTIFGLLGPNGAGKTTAIRVRATVIEPDGGSAEATSCATRRQYAATSASRVVRGGRRQSHGNLQLIGRLVHLPRRAIGARSRALLERFELSAAADRSVRTYSGACDAVSISQPR